MKNHRNQRPNMLYYSKYKWNRRLPKLMNKEYMILYGIAPNNGRLDMDLNTFTSRYKQKPFEMFNDYKYTTNYINKQGRRIQNDVDKRVTEMSPIYQPICIIIKKADLKALDTSSTADIITANTAINNEQAELLREISILSNLQKHKTFKISNCQNCQK